MKILVTGGAGFIGSTLNERLLALGHEVTCLDNFDGHYDARIKRHNVASAARSPRFRLVEGDIGDAALVDRLLLERVDSVVHLAARPGVRPSIADPAAYERVNVLGTITLLEACRRHPVRHFVFASSSSVYGLSRDIPFHEETSRLLPASPYGVTKLAGEYFCRAYQHLHAIPITCLRFFTVYGPRQRPDMAIHRFVRLIEEGKPIPVYGDGTARRDFTYVDDVVDGVVRAIERPQGFKIYNLGTHDTIMLRDLVAVIERALGKTAAISRQPDQPGDVPITYADVSEAGRDLGYAPSTRIEAGVARFVEWFRTSRAVVASPDDSAGST
ncbi:MAG TPA: NAD-dependent epimerase/dehydratase family protein [bacterium]|nr:NAD-dependent epimerase/dehydratase family protein [bacterium]